MNLSDLFPRRRFARLRRDARGVSAVEFALIAPVLVIFYFGCIEVSTMLITDRKVTGTAASVADLTARASAMDSTEMTNIFNSGVISMAPNDFMTTRIRVSSVEWNSAGTATVVGWSQATTNWTARAANAPITVPTGLMPAGGSLIYAEVEYDYTSITGLFDAEGGLLFSTDRKMSDDYWIRPRRTDVIPFS